jgi:outer membrane protein assembly factor BamB
MTISFRNCCIALLFLTYAVHSQRSTGLPDKPNQELDSLYWDGSKIIIPTFLGNWQRNYYGNIAPDSLNLIWKLYLGEGETVISRKLGTRKWKGAGWTGQPLLVQEKEKLYLVQGAFDHHLKKIDAETGQIVWQYAFDDVVKGTGTLWYNKTTSDDRDRIVILQGSRLGVGNYLDSKHIPSFRAVSYASGEELWRLDVKWTDSYSRDADGSALVINDTGYAALENSLLTVFSPDYRLARIKDNMLQPEIFSETALYRHCDVIAHKNNVVTESSPALLGDVIYVASGAGRVYGYHLIQKKLVWEFYIGSDIDGSVVVTGDSCLLVSVEKQYIRGKGGVFKLDPSKSPEEAVCWYYPTGDRDFAGWEGGVIGTVGINDSYADSAQLRLACFIGIDGYLHLISHMQLDQNTTVLGPDSSSVYPTPHTVFSKKIGASIATPIIAGNKLIAPSYAGLYLFLIDDQLRVKQLAKFPGTFEATPIVHNRKVFIASRNGYFYCLGNRL